MLILKTKGDLPLMKCLAISHDNKSCIISRHKCVGHLHQDKSETHQYKLPCDIQYGPYAALSEYLYTMLLWRLDYSSQWPIWVQSNGIQPSPYGPGTNKIHHGRFHCSLNVHNCVKIGWFIPARQSFSHLYIYCLFLSPRMFINPLSIISCEGKVRTTNMICKPSYSPIMYTFSIVFNWHYWVDAMAF